MLRPGLVSITFRDLSAGEVIDAAVRAGLSGIEWGGDVHVPHGSTSTARTVNTMTTNAGLQVAAYGSYYRFEDCLTGNGPQFDTVLKTAVELQAPLIRVWAGSKGSNEVSEDERQAIIRHTQWIADRAAKEQIRVAFEYHHGTLTDTNDSALSLLQQINHANVSTLWQPPPGASTEYSMQGLRSILPYLANIHCFHWGPGGFTDKRPLREGQEDWLQYLSLASEATDGSLTRWVLMEFVPNGTVEALLRDAAVLQQWLRRVQEHS